MTTARRLLALLSQAPLVLEGADRGFYQGLRAQLGWQASIILSGSLAAATACRVSSVARRCDAGEPLPADSEALRRRATTLARRSSAARSCPTAGM